MQWRCTLLPWAGWQQAGSPGTCQSGTQPPLSVTQTPAYGTTWGRSRQMYLKVPRQNEMHESPWLNVKLLPRCHQIILLCRFWSCNWDTIHGHNFHNEVMDLLLKTDSSQTWRWRTARSENSWPVFISGSSPSIAVVERWSVVRCGQHSPSATIICCCTWLPGWTPKMS